jgi:hypothetical protein
MEAQVGGGSPQVRVEPVAPEVERVVPGELLRRPGLDDPIDAETDDRPDPGPRAVLEDHDRDLDQVFVGLGERLDAHGAEP